MNFYFQSGIYCYCGNTYDRYGPTTCKKPCGGDASQICGDTWGITVYSGNIARIAFFFCVNSNLQIVFYPSHELRDF